MKLKRTATISDDFAFGVVSAAFYSADSGSESNKRFVAAMAKHYNVLPAAIRPECTSPGNASRRRCKRWMSSLHPAVHPPGRYDDGARQGSDPAYVAMSEMGQTRPRRPPPQRAYSRPVFLSKRTIRSGRIGAAMGQGTKSLRDSGGWAWPRAR